MSIMDSIKKASIGAVGASNPVIFLYGEVLSIEDFKIKIDQKKILDKDFFIIPESLTRYEVDLIHTHSQTGPALGKLVIREGLKPGDTVLLLRVQGGQQYVILDKVV